MRQNIVKQNPLFKQNIYKWIEIKQSQFIARIRAGHQYAIVHLQQRIEAHLLTGKYTDKFAMLECRLIAAKDLAKFDGIKPIIFEDQRLGVGGFFNVHAAEWADKQNLAVKRQIPSTVEKYPETSYMEAHYHRAITNAHQKNVVPLSYLYYHNNEFYIFMPKYKRSLQKYLEENIATITFDKILNFALTIVTVIDGIHQNDHVHRDIKSSNVLLDNDDQCHLSDFGTVKAGALNSTLVGTLPVAKEVLNATVYQQQNISTVYDGKAVDMFAYGILLYELLPKKEFRRPNMSLVYAPKTLFEDEELRPLPADMQDYIQLILQCLDQNCEQRPTASMIVTRIKTLIQRNEIKRCKICSERSRTVRTLPCGHKVLCQQCRADLRSRNHDLCIVCKSLIQSDVHDD